MTALSNRHLDQSVEVVLILYCFAPLISISIDLLWLCFQKMMLSLAGDLKLSYIHSPLAIATKRSLKLAKTLLKRTMLQEAS